jgi:outer membrane protease
MKTFVRQALLLLAVIVVCQTGIALAGDYYWVSSEKTDMASAAGDQKAAAPAKSLSSPEESICSDKCGCNNACDGCVCSSCDSCRTWYVVPEIQEKIGYTSFEFGGYSPDIGPFTPLSKLDYSLNSTWIGLRVGVERCDWDVHLEWLMPMVQHIDGGMYDYDWNTKYITPQNDPSRLDSLSHAATRWNDGQQINLEADYKYSDCFLGMPIEVWPLAGFRFQRFDMTAYGGYQIVSRNNVWGPPDRPFDNQGDGLTINQQYYTGYLGFQLRKCIERECRPPVNLAFQFDWGGTGAYMVDHHLQRETDMYTIMSTGGDSVHLALSGDVPLNCHLALGLRADYQRIRTTGSMTQIQNGEVTYTGNYGVLVKSEQTDITAYLQYTF